MTYQVETKSGSATLNRCECYAEIVDNICSRISRIIKPYIPQVLWDSPSSTLMSEIHEAVSKLVPATPKPYDLGSIVLFVGAKCITRAANTVNITDRENDVDPVFIGCDLDGNKIKYRIDGALVDPLAPKQLQIYAVLNDYENSAVAEAPTNIAVKLFVGAICKRSDGSEIKVVDYVSTPQSRPEDVDRSGRFIAVRADGLGSPLSYDIFGAPINSTLRIVSIKNSAEPTEE